VAKKAFGQIDITVLRRGAIEFWLVHAKNLSVIVTGL